MGLEEWFPLKNGDFTVYVHSLEVTLAFESTEEHVLEFATCKNELIHLEDD